MLLVSCLHLVTVIGQVAEKTRWLKDGEIFLGDYLVEANKDLGCFFTLEYFQPSDSMPDPTVVVLPAGMRHDTYERVTNTLKQYLPGYDVDVDHNKTNVIHLAASGLIRNPYYGLNREVTLSYRGNLGRRKAQDSQDPPGLLLKINEQVHTVYPVIAGGGSGDCFDDTVTFVDLPERRAPVRNLLTDAVPVQNYSPVLWRAVSHNLPVGVITGVQFYGPRRVSH